MTVNEKLVDFESALDLLIERALTRVGNAQEFLSINRQIEQLLSETWPDLVADLKEAGASAAELAILRRLSDALSRLETQSRARLVWAEDFDEYMRSALSTAPK